VNALYWFRLPAYNSASLLTVWEKVVRVAFTSFFVRLPAERGKIPQVSVGKAK